MRPFPFPLLAGLVLLAPRAHAQPSFRLGPRVGLNEASYRLTESVAGFTPAYRPGLEAGLAGTADWGHFALQAAVLYAQKGSRQRTQVEFRTAANGRPEPAEFEHAERLDYLTLPVSLAYALRGDGHGLQAYAGPYLGVLLGGRFVDTVTPQTAPAVHESGALGVGPDATPASRAVRRVDAGFQGGLGYRCHGFLFQAGYSVGVRNVSADTGLPARYNRAFQGALSYELGAKK